MAGALFRPGELRRFPDRAGLCTGSLAPGLSGGHPAVCQVDVMAGSINPLLVPVACRDGLIDPYRDAPARLADSFGRLPDLDATETGAQRLLIGLTLDGTGPHDGYLGSLLCYPLIGRGLIRENRPDRGG